MQSSELTNHGHTPPSLGPLDARTEAIQASVGQANDSTFTQAKFAKHKDCHAAGRNLH